MRYAVARFKTEQRDLAYRIYITDSLRAIGRLDRRYFDSIADDFRKTLKPSESAEDIISRIQNGVNNLGKEEKDERIQPFSKSDS
jgi:hypothetical protein